jgi:hypothetical protein
MEEFPNGPECVELLLQTFTKNNTRNMLPLITVLSSHLEGSILCNAMRSSAGVRGDVWLKPSECVPSNLRTNNNLSG